MAGDKTFKGPSITQVKTSIPSLLALSRSRGPERPLARGRHQVLSGRIGRTGRTGGTGRTSRTGQGSPTRGPLDALAVPESLEHGLSLAHQATPLTYGRRQPAVTVLNAMCALVLKDEVSAAPLDALQEALRLQLVSGPLPRKVTP